MILTSTATHRIFIQHSKTWNCFSRIQNMCAGALDGINKFARQSGDPTQSLQHVQNHALTGKQDPRVVPDHGDGLPFVQANAIKDFAVADNFRMPDNLHVQPFVSLEDPGNGAQPGQNAVPSRTCIDPQQRAPEWKKFSGYANPCLIKSLPQVIQGCANLLYQYVQLSNSFAQSLYHMGRRLLHKFIIIQSLLFFGPLCLKFFQLFSQSLALRSNINFLLIDHKHLKIVRNADTGYAGKRLLGKFKAVKIGQSLDHAAVVIYQFAYMDPSMYLNWNFDPGFHPALRANIANVDNQLLKHRHLSFCLIIQPA